MLPMSMVTRKLKMAMSLLYLVDDVMVTGLVVVVVVQVRLCSSMVEDTTPIDCDVMMMMMLPLIVVGGGDYFHYDYDHRPS